MLPMENPLPALLFLLLARKWLRRRSVRTRVPRGPRIPALTWEEFMNKPLLARNNKGAEVFFKRLFRMDEAQFNHLAKSLDEHIESTSRKGKHGKRMGAPRKVETKVALAMTLHYLAGGSYLDICTLFNVLPTTFYRTVSRTVDELYGVLPPWQLQVALERRDSEPERLDRIRKGFARKGRGYITNCIGAIDGVLLPIEAANNFANASDFYCRKGFHALNVQAISDTDGRIIYATVGVVPGCAHDSWAWKQDSMCGKLRDAHEPIAQWLKMRGLHLIGDDAYACSHTLVTPWPGTFSADAPELAYNELHASLRSSIERAFGMMCRKWLLLKRPFKSDQLRHTKESPGIHMLAVVAMKLHNYPINLWERTRVFERRHTDFIVGMLSMLPEIMLGTLGTVYRVHRGHPHAPRACRNHPPPPVRRHRRSFGAP
jgi:hypothetical protein